MNIVRKTMVIVIIELFIGASVIPGISEYIEISATMENAVSECTIKSYLIDIDFSKPLIQYENGFITVEMDQTDTYTSIYGEPVIPIYNQVLTFPIGTEIVDVKCNFSSFSTMKLSRRVIPAPHSLSLRKNTPIIQKNWLNEKVYESPEFYPSMEYSYHLGGGINDGKHVTFLSVQLFPVRYSPSKNEINYAKEAIVKISYKEQLQTISEINDKYDFLVIAPSEFYDNLRPLVTHKNSHYISTKLITLEEINGSGRDKQEQIKYYIKNAIEHWNTQYVLLVGNKNKFPIRLSNYTQQGRYSQEPFISDLYYADIYDENRSFCSWDTNSNNVFGEIAYNKNNSSYNMIDDLDFYPDVYLGRIPCNNSAEVDIVIDKIIKYENETYEQPWFKNIILCGGNDAGGEPLLEYITGGITWEGEYLCNIIEDIMKDFHPTKLFASARIPFMNKYNAEPLSAENLNQKINNGAGFLVLNGHGWNHIWSTHPPLFKRLWIEYNLADIQMLDNGEKTPFILTTGCHCGDFYNVFSPIIWDFVRYEKGGAIAGIASTASTLFYKGRFIDSLGIGFYEKQLFEAYARGIHVAGSLFVKAQVNYLNQVFNTDNPGDIVNIEGITLFGDPTLRIGGYPNELSDPIAKADIIQSGYLGQNIFFDGSGSYDPDGIIVEYHWDFGDGTYGNRKIQTHRYNATGKYKVTLTVIDNTGLTDNDTFIITIDNLDQQQKNESGRGYRFNQQNWLAQGFNPTFDTLTRIELKMFKNILPINDIVTSISIRNDLNKSDLVNLTVSCDEIPDHGWGEFDFPDIAIQPDQQYYIIVKVPNDIEVESYIWCWYYENDMYESGLAWHSQDFGDSWSKIMDSDDKEIDFCFRTYGI